MSSLVERALGPLDRLRTGVLRATRPWSGRLAGDRHLRVTLLGTAVVLLAASLAVLAPLWLLALGPLILGVPHLLADLRYCGVRSGLLTRRATLLACGLPLLVMGIWGGLALGLVAVAAAFVWTPGPAWRRAIGALVALLAATVAARHPYPATLAMAHAHNFVAVALWWWWRPRPASHLVPLVGFVGVTTIFATGAADGWVQWQWGPHTEGLGALDHAAVLAGPWAGPWALRLVLVYAFAQAVHYGVWLHLVRDDDRERPTPRTFRASWAALVEDLGRPVLCIATVLALALAAWAAMDLVAARDGYFRFATFHGSLELCAAAIFLVRGRPRA